MISLVQITINNKKIMVEAETTILNAAKQAGIKIPTLCTMPEIDHNPGSCRICVVEVEGLPTLVASCVYPVREDLVIHTHSERVIKTRKTILELLLNRHPLDCMTCEKNGNCDLQDLAYELGIKESRFGRIDKELPLDDPKVRCPDISSAKKELKWEPKVQLEDGLRKTMEWFKTTNA